MHGTALQSVAVDWAKIGGRGVPGPDSGPSLCVSEPHLTHFDDAEPSRKSLFLRCVVVGCGVAGTWTACTRHPVSRVGNWEP